jgi:hypothetical protein
VVELQVHRHRDAADGHVRVVEGGVCDYGEGEEDGRGD